MMFAIRKNRWWKYLLSAGAVTLAAGAPALAQNTQDFPRAETPGFQGPAEAPLKQAMLPLSQQFGVVLPAQPMWVDVPGLDLGRVLAEDAAATTGRLREGVAVPVTFEPAMGQWIEVPKARGGGWLYVCDFKAPGAFGVRLHFTDFLLPKDARATVYDPGIPNNLPGDYTYAGPQSSGEFWGWTSWSDTARLEVYYPPTAEAERFNPHFKIDQVIRMYRDPATGMAQAYGQRELGCHNDLECFPNWITNGAGVGRMSFVFNGGSYACTGSMLNNTSNDLTPYFMSAHHCMEDNGGALSSLDVYWFFQRSGCTGSTPAIGSCPRSSYSNYVRSDLAVDMSLVMIEGTIPRNLWWAGNNSASQAYGTNVVGIHHPDGSRKRISFGTYHEPVGCSATGLQNGFWVDYTNGVTEPGSSGSPLYTSNGAFLGQDSCGNGRCPAPGYETAYGSWFVGYGSFATFVNNPGFDDSNENNDTCAAAFNTNIYSNGTLYSQYVKSTDQDWFRRTVPGFGSCTFHARFIHARGDIDMQLHDGCGATLVTSSGTTDDETITWTNPGSTAREVYLNVYLYNDTRNIYYLDFATYAPIAPSNNACGSATLISVGGTAYGTTQNASVDGSSQCGSTGTAPDVWYRIVPPCTGTVTLDTQGSDYDTVLSVHYGCPGNTANQVICNDDVVPGTLWSQASFFGVGGTQYLVRVSGYNGAFGHVTLHASQAAPSNDLCANALPLGPGTYAFNNCACDTDGPPEDACLAFGSNQVYKDFWIAFTPTCYGSVDVNTLTSGFDTRIAVYANPNNSSCPAGPNSAIACNDDVNAAYESQVIFNCVAGQRYIFRVGSYAAGVGRAGTLHIVYTPANPCTPPTGACCIGGECSLLPQADCLNSGGSWLGEGTNCDDPAACTPLPTGACCNAGVCEVRSQVDCDNAGGVWHGAGTTCDDPAICNEVPSGACCTAGQCTIATEVDCTGNGGTWAGAGTTCDNPDICTAPTGSCCVAQWCSIGTEADCAALGGVWTLNGICEDGHCVAGVCGSADFNHDGDTGTDQDIESFFRCLGGDCCASCDTSDFNGDGDIGTDQDIEGFFRVLAGGNC